MKMVSVSILCICLVAATFSNWFIIAAYQINQQYISSTLCINKANAAMHCNGHCYLSRQLSQQEKPSSPINTKSTERFEIQLYCISFPASNINKKTTAKSYCNQLQNFTAQQFLSGSFHPPQA